MSTSVYANVHEAGWLDLGVENGLWGPGWEQITLGAQGHLLENRVKYQNFNFHDFTCIFLKFYFHLCYTLYVLC